MATSQPHPSHQNRPSLLNHVPEPSKTDTAGDAPEHDPETVALLYEEARYTFGNQVKRIEWLNTRSTWTATTGGAVVAAVLSQAKNIGDTKPSALGIWLMVIGTTIAVVAVLFAIRAAGSRLYVLGMDIDKLKEGGTRRTAATVKYRWIDRWRDYFKANERIINRRAMLLDYAFIMLILAVTILVVGGIYIISSERPDLWGWMEAGTQVTMAKQAERYITLLLTESVVFALVYTTTVILAPA